MATLFSAGADPPARAERGFLDGVERLLSLPFPLQPSGEIRRLCFLAIAGLAAVGLGVGLRRSGTASVPGSASSPAVRAVVGLQLVLIGVAVCSALANGSLPQSLGWLATQTAGLLWMVWIARTLSPRGAVALRAAGAGLAILAFALTLASWYGSNLLQPGPPIGAVTGVGVLAAILGAWTAPGAARAARAIARRRFDAAFARLHALDLCAFIVSMASLVVAGRRGAMFALATAVAFGLVLSAWRMARQSGRTGWARAATVGMLVAAVAAAAWLYRSRNERTVDARRELWRETLAVARTRPLLGVGPERFAAEMTTRFATRRSENPHRYTRDMVNAAHNEWLQGLMELGWLGGAAYVAVPLLILGFVGRRWLGSAAPAAGGESPPSSAPTSPTPVAGVEPLAPMMAAVALMVADASSVFLRSSMGPPWYWTILGMLLAERRFMSPPAEHQTPRHVGGRPGPARLGLAAATGLLGAALVALSVAAWRSGRAHAQALALIGRGPHGTADVLARLNAVSLGMDGAAWLRLWRDRGLAANTAVDEAIRAWQASPDDGALRSRYQRAMNDCIASWRSLFVACPGYPDAGGQLARALVTAAARDEAGRVLAQTVALIPFDRTGHALLAAEFAADAAARIDHLLRAIRNGRLEGEIEVVLIQHAADFETPAWRARVDRAAAAADPSAPLDPQAFAAEVLRIEAWRLARRGVDAREPARLAVAVNRRTIAAAQPWGPMAVSETWQMLAAATYLADPRHYGEALKAIRNAEDVAIGNSAHTVLRLRAPDGVSAGRIVPDQFPDQLRSMWALSSLLHLAAGRTQWLAQRVAGSLPSEGRTPDSVRRALAEYALQLHQDFARFPPAERPPHYDSFLTIVRQNAPELASEVK